MSRGNRTLPLSPNLRDNDARETTCIRFEYARNGALIYVAHLDMLRIFERALVRSELKYASSQGFNPRPLMVFALPVGVGIEVERDQLEIVFFGRIDPKQAMIRLNNSLPKGINVISAQAVDNSGKSIMALVRRAEYVFESEGISDKAESIIDAQAVPVKKGSGAKEKVIDIRPLIVSAQADSPDRFRAVFNAGSRNNLRPDLFLKALVDNGSMDEAQALDTRIIRTCVYLDRDIQEETK